MLEMLIGYFELSDIILSLKLEKLNGLFLVFAANRQAKRLKRSS